MSGVSVFVSFDVEHDEDLYELLLAQSLRPGSAFTVSGGSRRGSGANLASPHVRRRIREADQVIVICGEHSESSQRMSAELALAQEEHTPYFLLWGRRDCMCTKPTGAKQSEGMYRWTRQILQDQLAQVARKAAADAAAESLRDAYRRR